MTNTIQEQLKSATAVMLYFKNDTCEPCKALRVKIDELLKTHYPKIKYIVLDIVEHPELVSQMNVLSSPTMILFLEGKEFFRGGIYTSIQDLDEKLSRLYKLVF